VITIDPANGSYNGLIPVPTLAARHFDFSSSADIMYDLYSCHSTSDGGMSAFPFPGNILPINRVSPQEVQILNTLPLPTTAVAGSATGLLGVQGTVRRGATFAIDQANNSALSVFAAYVPVRTLCASDQVTTVRLIIDGRQVASTDVKYTAGGLPFPGGPQ
jgi:hypothetical protein